MGSRCVAAAASAGACPAKQPQEEEMEPKEVTGGCAGREREWAGRPGAAARAARVAEGVGPRSMCGPRTLGVPTQHAVGLGM